MDLAAKASMLGVLMGEVALWMDKRGAEIWSARMKRTLGFLGAVSGHSPVGGEALEAREDGGVLGAVSGDSMSELGEVASV